MEGRDIRNTRTTMGRDCDECRELGRILLYCGRCDMVVCKHCRGFHHGYLHDSGRL